MSLDAARLAEIHGNIDHHLLRIVDLADLLSAHDALTAQVAALHEALQRTRTQLYGAAVMCCGIALSETLTKAANEPLTLLADTAAAAEAFKRQQQLIGARELVRRSWSVGTPWSGVDAVRHSALKSIMDDMEREAANA